MRESCWSPALTLVVTFCVGWSPQSPAHGENVVVNGSFEMREPGEPNRYIDTLTPVRKDLVGWQVVDGSVDWVGPTRWTASHGKHCLDVDAPGSIRQILRTAPGRKYRLQFDLAGNVETEPLKKLLRVSISGQSYDFPFDAAGHTRDKLGWVRKEIIFIARSDKTTLSFSNNSAKPTASGVAIDNVVVVQGAPGRYTIPPAAVGTILVDRATGQTWKLMPYKEKTAWLPIEPLDRVNRLRELGANVSLKSGIVSAVDLTDSTITDADMEVLVSLGSLEHLILNGCRKLTDAGLVHLKGLTALKGLGLERTHVTDAGLQNLGRLTRLDYLSLNGTRIGDAGLKHLAALTDLEVLYLAGTNTTDAGLVSLKDMSRLRWLDLRGTAVGDTGLRHLGSLAQLRLLCLHGIRMTDAGVPPLTELSNLEVLTLSRTRLTDAGLSPLTKLPKLKELDVTGTKVTQEGVDKLTSALPKCRVRFRTVSPASERVAE